MPKSPPFKVFLADDHPLLRTGLRMSLSRFADIDFIGEASDGFKAVEKIKQNPPDVALIDVDMPGLSGIAAVRMLRKQYPDMTLLILSSYSDKHFIEEAMQAGADGYVLKSIDINELADLIRAFSCGEHPMSPYLMDLAVDWHASEQEEESPADKDDESDAFLTRREQQILSCLAQGQGNKEISNALFISTETVKTHIKNIFKKLEVKSRLEAVIAAKEKKLID
ncbi:helix-turn-helix transcriptional response regulator, LuxR family [Syntrophotalea carbinolica DSM 2380]|uniref:Helix-turn-helix transcriptional response regulator, LuxR family n=1 Tax=Syntrophotalea carbinolica (strain DSM 2380 / NBRC 103641 / GraBd1) TaxID=338963 RepID=Q3A5X6_SYNC1|nr:response regulator transcription factor [Syntrophotalea carbinolica]ABA88231.1 helix-turn-helix transcriptional response regulator, LuxR family [Syntrophotalea carbinolica DSM 2380]